MNIKYKTGFLLIAVFICIALTSQFVFGNSSDDKITAGTESYRGFSVDNVYHSAQNGDIHYNVYFPKNMHYILHCRDIRDCIFRDLQRT